MESSKFKVQSSETETLLPCPFCGNSPSVNYVDLPVPAIELWTISCIRCRVHMYSDGPMVKAFKSWNRRAKAAEEAEV